ncbi:Interferon gamma [Pitangus sulphuratus]|nr:Interferon gamma [Pitangus sulphuratus]
MTFQTYSLFVLSIIMIYFGRVENRFNLLQLQDDIDKLKADFNSSHSDVGDGGPIFMGRLSNWTERNEKRIILSQIVSMYLKILENTDQSKAHVKNITEELYTLKESLSDGSKKMEYLKDLTKLQAVNVTRVIFSLSLFELDETFHTSSTSGICKHMYNKFSIKVAFAILTYP